MDIRRGIIRAFDSGTYLADVQIVGSMATMLPGVPVAKQIGADLLTSGTKCGVLFFDETNPSDACVVFVYDGAPVPWITSALIKDGEVAAGDLAFDPATQAELDAHAPRTTSVHGFDASQDFTPPGHIIIPQGKEFRPGGDANTAFGEDGSGNAYLKDANAGTKTVKQMASTSALARASSTLTLTTSRQDVAGASLSLGAGTYLIFGVFDFYGDNNGAVAVGELDVGGAAQGGAAFLLPDGTNSNRVTAIQIWRKTLASTTTVKLRAFKTADVGTFLCYQDHTAITALRTGD